MKKEDETGRALARERRRKLERKRPQRGPRHRWEDLREIG
jgi:hypothetical protein